MADAEAAKKLPDLDQRMEALEREYGNAEGDPWTNERAAEEYDGLSDQYQKVWDAIFIGLLKESGEQDIADLYAAGSDEFARRYAAGEMHFRTRIEINPAASFDDLVRVASYVNVPQAELARNVLESEGIPAAVANLNLVLWDWEYSNATGGVSVHVRRADAQRAYLLLTQKKSPPPGSQKPWICRSCGQRISGEWKVCWHCGCSIDGLPGELPVQQPVAPAPGDGVPAAALQVMRVLGSAVIVLLVLLPLSVGLVAQAIANAVFVGLLIGLLGRLASSADSRVAALADSDPRDVRAPSFVQTRSSVSRAIVQRAWQAAVFGCCGFPPLGIYSLRLLWKLAGRNTPLGTADRWRVGLAFVFSLMAVLFCLIFVVLIAGYVLNVLGSMVGRPY